ncbi:MAG: histidine phosphatase family protein [Rhizomicrobium sp.]
MTSHLTLICHAATAAQRLGAFPRDDGIEPGPAKNLDALRSIATTAGTVLCAPERRALETAGLLGLQVATTDTLRDCDLGNWRGRHLKDIQRDDPNGTVLWLSEPGAKPHGGESLTELFERVDAWLETLPAAGHIVAVTHASVMRAAVLHALRAPADAFWRLDVEPLSTIDMRHNGRFWSLRSFGR